MRHSEGLRAASNAGPDYSGVVIGDYLEGGYFGGWVNYGNFNATSPSHGLIIAEQSARVSKQVNDTNSTVNLATNSQSDGLANMDSFVGSEWVAANYCRDYSKDGYSDWYIPSLMEWGVLAWNFCPDICRAPATLGTTANYWECAWNFDSLEDFCWVYNDTDKVFSITKDGPACSTLLLGDIGANSAGGRVINNVIDVKAKLNSHDASIASHTQQLSDLTSTVNTSQAGVYYSDSAPTVSLNDGALWFDSQNLRLNVRHGGAWLFPDRVEDTALKSALLNAVNTSTDYASLKTNLIAALS